MKFRSLMPVIVVLLALAVTPSLKAENTEPLYHVTKRVALGAPDQWDFVVYDSNSHRVYVAHGDRVTVVDGRSGEILGQVMGFPGGTHGIATVGALGQGYTDDSAAGEAGSFDLKTFTVDKRIKADKGADSITYDPSSGHVFVVNISSGTLTVINPETAVGIATIKVGSSLETAVPGNDGKLYVNGAEKNAVFRIDTRRNVVDAEWPVPQCTSPHGLAIDTKNQRLFVSCRNKSLTVLNSTNGKTVANLPIGEGTDSAAFDPKRKLIFSANGQDGTLSIIRERDPNTFETLDAVQTQLSAKTMTLDPVTGRLFLVAGNALPPKSARSADAPRGPIQIAPGSLELEFLDPAR